jgi:hypothetical protein
MFFQIGRRYTPFSALHQFFPTLPIIYAQGAAKNILRNPLSWPLKLKKNVQRSNTRAIPAD